ncbi:MAG: hypothetical protein K0R17_1225 [Rariglobus sp.]|jgi:hypothetical protein|nr:hypothetical protein [Rariglobus sp.]
MDTYLDSFTRAATHSRPALAAQQIEAHVGRWHESAVLKLQKRRWTSVGPAPAPSEAGLFFSVWINEKSLRQQRVCYNIHALKLRSLAGFSIQSREFAAAFRAAFASSSGDWSHVSTDYGPQTLMEGWIDLDAEKTEADVAVLIRRFIPLADLIDRLLDQRTS